VTVETWLIPANPWHIRVHRIETSEALKTIEGGFAIRRSDFGADRTAIGEGHAQAENATDISAIHDLTHPAKRAARAHFPLPNTNLIHAKTIVPQLTGTVPAGVTVLMTAAMALPLDDRARAQAVSPPQAPELAALKAHFDAHGVPPGVFTLKPKPASGPRPN
jgi:hypothetical protein